MKIKRILLMIGLGLLTLTGCATQQNDGDTSTSKLNNYVSLNVNQANLIADITDNEKYLNKDYLYSLEGLENDDNINIIITLSNSGLSDSYNSNSKGYNTLGEFASSSYANSKIRGMKNEQNKLAEELL